MFPNFQIYDSHHLFQEVRKYNFKTNVMLKSIKKYMRITIKQAKMTLILDLAFIDSIHFLNGSLDNLVKNLGKNDFYHLNQKWEANLLNLVYKKEFFTTTIAIAFKKGLPRKDKFYNF